MLLTSSSVQPVLVHNMRLFQIWVVWQRLIVTLPRRMSGRDFVLVSECFKWPLLCWFMHQKHTGRVRATGLKCNKKKKKKVWRRSERLCFGITVGDLFLINQCNKIPDTNLRSSEPRDIHLTGIWDTLYWQFIETINRKIKSTCRRFL